MQILGVWIFDSFNKAQKIFPKKQKRATPKSRSFFTPKIRCPGC